MATIQQELHRLEPSAIVELYEIDVTELGGSVFRMHAGTNQLQQPIVWRGQSYTPFPVEVKGFEATTQGTLPRPKMRVANITGLMGALVREYDDLLGAKVTRRRTMVKFLDAVNFEGGVNPTADPDAELPSDIFFIDRKASENKVLVEFELASSIDLAGVTLPRRVIVPNVCPWRYRGGECGYAGNSFWDVNDAPVSEQSKDACGKKISSCKLRFGEFNALPYGGFPAAGMIR